MKGVAFPVTKMKVKGINENFSLEDPAGRKKYFEAKVGKEIEKIKVFLEKNTFVAFLLGKKNSGKGTYSKLFAEAVGKDKIKHISVGDVVRDAHQAFEEEKTKGEMIKYLEKKYRGFLPLEKAIDALLGRSTTTLLPVELILTLIEREISLAKRKAVFVDGFPRSLDQVSYALYFRHLMGYRDDPDFFVFIDVPEAVIDERMKYRRICPVCHTPRNLKLLATKEVGYDEKKKEFFLKCDNPECKSAKMITKEGDDLGIEAIRDRIELDDKIMRMLIDLQGVPKIFLRNSIPVDAAQELVDDYEITPGYRYEIVDKIKKVKVVEEPYVVKDDDGIPSYSLMPAPVVVSLIKQTVEVLDL